MKRKRITAIVIFLFVALLLIGCPMPGQKIKTLDEMSPKEKATWMLSMYNKQFDDYNVVAARTDLTEPQKVILRKKKKVLTEVYPLIEMYASYVKAGAVPAKETEDQIINYLNELAKMLTD